MAGLGFEERPVYRLEPDDDIQDVIRALQKTRDPLAIFFDHAEAAVLKNEVNLRLLLDYAKEAGRQVVLITQDPVLMSLAEEQDIQCFPNEYELSKTLGLLPELEEADDTQAPLVSFEGRRFGLQQWLVLIIAAAAVGLLYYVLVPKVTVVVTPGVLIYQQSVEVLGLGAGSDGTEMGSLPVLPLRPVKAVIGTEAVVSATGSQTLGTSSAKGTAVLINEGDEPVTVPKGTKLKTGEGVFFQTDEVVTVPARSAEYFLDVATGVRAGQKEVGITAIEAGEKGNVAAGRIRVFGDSELGKRLVARNPEPVSGGVSVHQTTVTEEDIERAKAACSRQAGLKAGEILQAKADQDGSVVIPESIQIEEENLTPETSIGEEAQTVKIVAHFHAQGQAFRRRDFGEVLEQELGKQLPEDLVLYQPKFEIERLMATLQNGSIVLAADVKAPVHRRLSESDLARLLVGLRQQEVGELAKVLDVDSIMIMPSEVERLPRFAHWIKVEVKAPEAAVAISQP